MHNEPPLSETDLVTLRGLAVACTPHRNARGTLSQGRQVECRLCGQARDFTFRYPVDGREATYRTIVTVALLNDPDIADFLRHRLEYAARHGIGHDNPRSTRSA